MVERFLEYRRLLLDHVLEPWFPRCLDQEYGGFHCDFDREWKLSDGGRKLLEFQARQTSATAEMLMCFPDNELLRSAVEAGFSFLSGPLWDHQYGGWYACTDRGGAPLNSGDKHAHGIAYAIEACFLASVALEDRRAASLGQDGLAWLNRHAFDNDFGGYWGPLARDGTLRSPTAATMQTDQLGTPYGLKDMNVNKDVLSMMTTIKSADPSFLDGEIYERQIEFVMRCFGSREIPTHRVSQGGDAVSRFWKPSETAQLAGMLIEAGPHTHRATELLATAKRLLDVSFARGWSQVGGGLIESIETGEKPTRSERRSVNWWSQFELLKSASYLVRLGEHSTLFDRMKENAWSSIMTCFLDRRYNGFTARSSRVRPWSLLKPQSHKYFSRKGDIWKDASHEARSLVRLMQVDRILAGNLPAALEPFTETGFARQGSVPQNQGRRRL